MSNHTCHATGCTTHCKPEYLMCPRHWRMVPRGIQAQVWRHYQDGQCQLKPMPSSKWHAAADLAIAAVAQREGRIAMEKYQQIRKKSDAVLKEQSNA